MANDNELTTLLGNTSKLYNTEEPNLQLNKDAHTKNITLADWNTLVNMYERTLADVERLYATLESVASNSELQVRVPLAPELPYHATSKKYVDDLYAQPIDGEKLIDLTVSGNKLKESAIYTSKIADNAVTTSKIDAGAITSDKILDKNIISSKIADGAVVTDKISNNAVTAEKIANGSVTAKKIPDGSVPIEKLSSSFREYLSMIETLAKEKGESKGFKTYAELIGVFNSSDKYKFRVGQSLYVATQYVTDLWIFGIADNYVAYTYTDDATIEQAFHDNLYIQVGYYYLAPLETLKVDLNAVAQLAIDLLPWGDAVYYGDEEAY